MRNGNLQSSLIVTLMILIVTATATMGWANGTGAKNGISMFMDGSGDLPQNTATQQRNQESSPVLAGGESSACCACNAASLPQIAGQAITCRIARLTKNASFLRVLKPEPPQAPPRI